LCRRASRGWASSSLFDAKNARHGFLLAEDIYTYPLDPPGSTNTRVLGTNNAGRIVGDYSVDRARHGDLLCDGAFTSLVGSYLAENGTFRGFLLNGST
jgi:hypothetical protein